MAMEMLDYSGFAKMERDRDVQQAASAGLEGVQRLMCLLSQQQQGEDCASIAGAAIAEFRKVLSLLGRSGHARVRRGPQSPSSSKDSSFSESLMASCSSNGAASASDSDGGSANTLFRPQPTIAAVAVQIAKQLPWSDPSCLCSESAYASAIAAFSPVAAGASPWPATSALPLGQAKREFGLCSNPPKSLFASGFPVNGGPAHAQSFAADVQSKVINGVLPKSALCRPDAALFARSPQQFFFQNPNGAFERVVKPYPSPSPTHSTPQAPARKMEVSATSCPPLFSAATTSFMSSLSLDGSVANGNQHALQSALIPGGSSGRPPLAVIRKKCSAISEDGGGKCSSSGKCHCSKRRKSRIKTVKLVPAISSKMSDIPSDEYSWRKYGQKPIKGSPHPRGYYKCSTVRGCPARKHVEKSLEDSSMLVITYEGEHSHPQPVNEVMQE